MPATASPKRRVPSEGGANAAVYKRSRSSASSFQPLCEASIVISSSSSSTRSDEDEDEDEDEVHFAPLQSFKRPGPSFPLVQTYSTRHACTPNGKYQTSAKFTPGTGNSTADTSNKGIRRLENESPEGIAPDLLLLDPTTALSKGSRLSGNARSVVPHDKKSEWDLEYSEVEDVDEEEKAWERKYLKDERSHKKRVEGKYGTTAKLATGSKKPRTHTAKKQPSNSISGSMPSRSVNGNTNRRVNTSAPRSKIPSRSSKQDESPWDLVDCDTGDDSDAKEAVRQSLLLQKCLCQPTVPEKEQPPLPLPFPDQVLTIGQSMELIGLEITLTISEVPIHPSSQPAQILTVRFPGAVVGKGIEYSVSREGMSILFVWNKGGGGLSPYNPQMVTGRANKGSLQCSSDKGHISCPFHSTAYGEGMAKLVIPKGWELVPTTEKVKKCDTGSGFSKRKWLIGISREKGLQGECDAWVVVRVGIVKKKGADASGSENIGQSVPGNGHVHTRQKNDEKAVRRNSQVVAQDTDFSGGDINDVQAPVAFMKPLNLPKFSHSREQSLPSSPIRPVNLFPTESVSSTAKGSYLGSGKRPLEDSYGMEADNVFATTRKERGQSGWLKAEIGGLSKKIRKEEHVGGDYRKHGSRYGEHGPNEKEIDADGEVSGSVVSSEYKGKVARRRGSTSRLRAGKEWNGSPFTSPSGVGNGVVLGTHPQVVIPVKRNSTMSIYSTNSDAMDKTQSSASSEARGKGLTGVSKRGKRSIVKTLGAELEEISLEGEDVFAMSGSEFFVPDA